MTDRESPEPDELSEPEVSALLGSLGDAEPIPDDVLSRLDATLAGLVRERRDEASDQDDAQRERSADVVPLGRTRRTGGVARRLLAAAAILGVVGVGAGVAGGLLGDVTGGQAEDATAGDAAESEDSGAASDDEGPAEESGGGRSESADQMAPEPSDEGAQGLTATRAVPEVGTDRALRRVVRVTAIRETAAYDERDALRDVEGKQGRAARCVTPKDAGGPTVAVTYRGDDATLVVRRAGGVLEGRVYDCTLGLLLDGVRLSTPAE